MDIESLIQVSLKDIDCHDNLLQTGFWGKLKSSFGWKPFAFMLNGNIPLLVLTRRFTGGFSLAYIPHGPIVKDLSPQRAQKMLVTLAEKLKPLLPGGTVVVRFDVPWGTTGADNFPEPFKSPLYRAPVDIQPSSTVIINLEQSEDDILKSMKAKTRYNIRLSEKKGVKVVEGSADEVEFWYDLLEETAVRDKITFHSLEYYKKLFSLSAEYEGPKPEIKLFLALIDREIEAGIIVSILGSKAIYLYGASSGQKRNCMPAYALQWEAIRKAKTAGCKFYDLFGIPRINDPDHPMYGLYRFWEHRAGLLGMSTNCNNKVIVIVYNCI